jgi:hypothetical protein
MSEQISRVFTLEVDGRPILAFEASAIREAQSLCKEAWAIIAVVIIIAIVLVIKWRPARMK